MRRPRDWSRQAQHDLAAAEDARGTGHFEWACFMAQQAAERAVRALHHQAGTEAWGHSVTTLLQGLGEVPAEILDAQGARQALHPRALS